MELRHELFLQEKQDSVYITDALCDLSFCLFLRVLTQDEFVFSQNPLQTIQFDTIKNKPTTLNQFIAIVDNAFKSVEFSGEYAFAACFLVEDRTYVVSRGLGGVSVLKEDILHPLISGDQSASGKTQQGIYLIIGPHNTHAQFKDTANISSIISTGDTFVKEMTDVFCDTDMGGLIVSTTKDPVENAHAILQEEEVDLENSKEEIVGDIQKVEKRSIIRSFIENIQTRKKILPHKNTVTIVLVVVIAGILLWSVVLGNQRRVTGIIDNKAKQLEGPLTTKLLDAEEMVLLDSGEALVQLKEAEALLNTVKQEAKSKNISNLPSIILLEKKIAQTKIAIDKVINKPAIEYYDTALLGNNTLVDRFVLTDTDSFGLLDSKNKQVYLIADEKKKITKYHVKQISAKMHFVFNDLTLFYFDKKVGVYMMEPDTTPKKIIDKDGWNNPIDITTFNKNVYILDSGSDEIFKYVSYEGGYAGKSSYFKQSESIDLSNALHFSVDASFYIAHNTGQISKYTSGIKQPLTLSPQKNISFTKVLTNKDTELLYLYSKDQGVVYVYQKNGTYSKELTSPQLKNATDITLMKDTVLILKNSKIYSLE